MKIRFQCLVAVLAAAPMAEAQPARPANEARASASFTVAVRDDEGKPMRGVEVIAQTFIRWQPGQGFGQDIWEGPSVTSDADGQAAFSFPSLRGAVRYWPVTPQGYYQTYDTEYQFKETFNGEWLPRSPVLELILKPIRNPIPLYARSVGKAPNELIIPELDAPVGFDFEKADWVTPHGKGRTADVLFTMSRQFTSMQEYAATLHVSFPNPRDGIMRVAAARFKRSALRLPRYAPEEGYSESVALLKSAGRRLGYRQTQRDDDNYFLRTRTVVNEAGKITRAHYARIMGPIDFDVREPGVVFAYYFNPTVNDRNLEFDPNRNLFLNIGRLDRPNEP